VYRATATDPENNSLTYTLSGGNSADLDVDSDGVITLKSGLTDFETLEFYTFTLMASDGVNTVSREIRVDVIDFEDEIRPTATIQNLPYQQIKLEAVGFAGQDDSNPDILEINDRGDFVVGWLGITPSNPVATWIQRFNYSGSLEGGSVELYAPGTTDTDTAYLDEYVRMARVSSAGHYVVTWMDHESGSENDNSPHVQLYNPDGTTTAVAYELEYEDNTKAATNQQVAAVGSDGEFAVVWSAKYTGTDVEYVHVQHFNSDGTTKTPIYRFTTTTGDSYRPKITAINDAGDYIVIFTRREVNEITNTWSIRYQKFNADGTANGELATVDGDDDFGDFDGRPEITVLGSNGAFAFSWHAQDVNHDWSIFVRKVDSSGTLLGEVKLETSETNSGRDRFSQIINIGDNEEFVVVWEGIDGGGDSSIFVQNFDNTGATSGSMVKLEATSVSNGDDLNVQVAEIGTLGAYVVVWQGQESATGDSSIYVQRFNPDGTVNGTATKLEGDGITAGNDINPEVTATGDRGGFVVTWQGLDSNGDDSVFVQQFYADGTTMKPLVIEQEEAFTAQIDEEGTLYLVHESITVTDINSITDSDGALWNSQAVTTANTDLSFSTAGLNIGQYYLYATDSVGNFSDVAEGSVLITDSSVVIFDLVRGLSSDHSNREFDSDTSYTIYLLVDSDSARAPDLNSVDWGTWSHAERLGADDKIILAGNDGNDLIGKQLGTVDQLVLSGNDIAWQTTGTGQVASITSGGLVNRTYLAQNFSLDLWSGAWGAGNNPNQGSNLTDVLVSVVPPELCTSQGLV
ncbi:cadherin repeat domain-containing protein, partial [Porticoccaceae bacterium]|nr:cadherin repeat domain-containing protein [Porticoccaceae bacterium]